MKRRRVLASLTGSVSLAACNILRGPTTDAGRSAHDTPVAAANDHLQRVFDSLAEYRIVEGGRPRSTRRAIRPRTWRRSARSRRRQRPPSTN
jgi:predicted small secreted protein